MVFLHIYLVVKAERVSPDKHHNFTSYVGGSAQLMIPNSLLQDISKYLAI